MRAAVVAFVRPGLTLLPSPLTSSSPLPAPRACGPASDNPGPGVVQRPAGPQTRRGGGRRHQRRASPHVGVGGCLGPSGGRLQEAGLDFSWKVFWGGGWGAPFLFCSSSVPLLHHSFPSRSFPLPSCFLSPDFPSHRFLAVSGVASPSPIQRSQQ